MQSITDDVRSNSIIKRINIKWAAGGILVCFVCTANLGPICVLRNIIIIPFILEREYQFNPLRKADLLKPMLAAVFAHLHPNAYRAHSHMPVVYRFTEEYINFEKLPRNLLNAKLFYAYPCWHSRDPLDIC